MIIFILGLIFLLLSPNFQIIKQNYIYGLTQQQTLNFFQLSLSKIQQQNKSWRVFIHKKFQRWAISIQPVEQINCDVLQDNSCYQQNIFIFKPKNFQKIDILAKKYFPERLSLINGKRMTSLPVCIKLKMDNRNSIFVLSNQGRIRLADNINTVSCSEF